MFKTVSLLWLSTMFGAGLAFITQIILARQLGVAEFGSFSAALATVMLVAPLAGFGVGGFWLNIFGKEGLGAVRWVRPSLTFSLYSTLAVIFLITACAMIIGVQNEKKILLIVLSICVIGQATIEIVSALLQLEERYYYFALWQSLHHALRLIGVCFIVLIFYHPTSINIAFAYTTASLFLFFLGIFPIKRLLQGSIMLKGHDGRKYLNITVLPTVTVSEVFFKTWPFGLSGVYYMIYHQVDIVLLKYIVNNNTAGVYNVAYLIVTIVYMLPAVIYQKFLMPQIHRWANNDMRMLYKVYLIGNQLMLLLGILTMVSIWLFSHFFVFYLFGKEYTESILLLNILALAIPIRFIGSSVGSVLSTNHHIIKKNQIMGIAAIVNFFLNIVMIIFFKAIGSAVITVATEMLLLFLMRKYADQYVFIEQK